MYLMKPLAEYFTCKHAVICNKCIGYVRHSMMVCSSQVIHHVPSSRRWLCIIFLQKVDPVNYWKQAFVSHQSSASSNSMAMTDLTIYVDCPLHRQMKVLTAIVDHSFDVTQKSCLKVACAWNTSPGFITQVGVPSIVKKSNMIFTGYRQLILVVYFLSFLFFLPLLYSSFSWRPLTKPAMSITLLLVKLFKMT